MYFVFLCFYKNEIKITNKKKRPLVKHLSNTFLFQFKSSFCSQENEILEFYILKFHNVIKCLSIKQEVHFTE